MRHFSIIGAGAAGCLATVELKRRRPDADVTVYEAGPAPMRKLALTGGGRCNLTNTFDGVADLRKVYPRGAQLMKGALKQFGPQETMRWFEAEGVRLTEEDGGRIFPASGDAMQVVRCLKRAMERTGVRTVCNGRITDIRPLMAAADAVIVTTGGSPKRSGLDFLAPLDLPVAEPVPSLFTLRVAHPGLKALSGTVVPDAALSLPGTPFRAEGPLLLTDWGVSGPATLRLSSYAARHLAGCGCRTPLTIRWTGGNEQRLRTELAALAAANPQKMAANAPLPGLPSRLWAFLLERSGLREGIRWAEIGSKGLNRLVSTLTNDVYDCTGRAAFKEEFVTCGGVDLSAIHLPTLEAKAYPGLYFAGEVLDVDAVTGGFNLQAAWSTGWICARSAATRA